MVKENPSINLLENKGKGFVDQFLDWALAIGRLLIIITETIALTAFLYRFSIDRKIIDLHDEIKINQTIVGAFKSREEEYRMLQKKLAVVNTQSAISNATVEMFQDLVTMSQEKDVTYNNLTVSNTNLEMSVEANSLASISSFIDSVRTLDHIESVKIDKVENRTTTALVSVSLSATLTKTASISAQTTTNIMTQGDTL